MNGLILVLNSSVCLFQTNICTIAPNLSSSFTVKPPSQYIFTRLQVRRYSHMIHHRYSSPFRSLISRAQSRFISFFTRGLKTGVWGIITVGTITAWGSRTWLAFIIYEKVKYRRTRHQIKVAFFQKVRFVFQISKSPNIPNHYPELEI